MAIPDFQTLMLPVLKFISSQKVSLSKEVISEMIREFELSDDEVSKLLPSETQRVNERKAKKGLFITTSHFSGDAQEYVNRIDVRIFLSTESD